MIFTFQGQNTYIFDLDETGKALVLNNGIVDLGDVSSPKCLAILRMEDNAVVMDIHATANNGELLLLSEEDYRSYILEDGDTVEISDNQLHVNLHRNNNGDLLGGEFILDNGDDLSMEKPNSDTASSGVKRKSTGLFETLIYSSQPEPTPKEIKNVLSNLHALPMQADDERLAETQIKEEKLDKEHNSVEDLSETRISVEDLSETRINEIKELRKSTDIAYEKSEQRREQKRLAENQQDLVRRENEKQLEDTSLIESTFFSVDIVNKQLPQVNKTEEEKRVQLLNIGDGIKEDTSTGEYEYHVMKYIGQGGFGQVYKIEDKYKNPFALKVLLPKVLEKSDFVLTLFDQEVGITRYLEYSGLVKALEHYYDEKRKLHYCIMTYIDGVSFTEVINYYVDKHSKMHYMYATMVVLRVAKVLDYLSEHGVVHRDIKPQNIMLTRDGEVKVLDLGISRRGYNNKPLDEKEVIGTLPYVPLGQFLHQDPVDVRVDIYSLGVMYFGLLTCEHPYTIPPRNLPRDQRVDRLTKELYKSFEKPSLTPNPQKKNKKVPNDVAKVIMKMIAQDVRRRYRSPESLIHDLEAITGNLTAKEIKPELVNLCDAVKNNKPVPIPIIERSKRKPKWIRMFGAVAAVFLFLGMAWMIVNNQAIIRGMAGFTELETRYKNVKNEKDKNKLLTPKTLDEINTALTQMEKDNGILTNPSLEVISKWTDCKKNIQSIQTFEKKANSLIEDIEINVPAELKESAWVKEAKELWPEEMQKKFVDIEKRFNVLEKKLDGKAQQAAEDFDKNTENIASIIQYLSKTTKTEYSKILGQIDNYVADVEIIKLQKEHLLKNNIVDEAKLLSIEDRVKGSDGWRDCCKTLWAIKDSLLSVDSKTADEIFLTIDAQLNTLETKKVAFEGFKEDFQTALTQIKQQRELIKKLLDIKQDFDNYYKKVNTIVVELAEKMASKEQLKEVQSICDEAERKMRDNPELRDNLISCKEMLEYMNKIRLALEILDEVSKKFRNANDDFEHLKRKISNLNIGKRTNFDIVYNKQNSEKQELDVLKNSRNENSDKLESMNKELSDVKNVLINLEGKREEDKIKLASMDENMFPKQVNELEEKWRRLIYEAQNAVNESQNVVDYLKAQILQQDQDILNEESNQLAAWANTVNEKVVKIVTWDWDAKMKEKEVNMLHKDIRIVTSLWEDMEKRQTNDKEKKDQLLSIGRKNHEKILGIVQEVENSLMRKMESFYKVKSELEAIGKEIDNIETMEENGGLMLENLRQKIDNLQWRNDRQFEPIAKLKDWSLVNPKFMPKTVMNNFKFLSEELGRLQTINGSRLSKQKNIMKDVEAFRRKLKLLIDNVSEYEELCNDIARNNDISRKNDVEYLYRQIENMCNNLTLEVNKVKNKLNLARSQAISKELNRAKSAKELCKKAFMRIEVFEKDMEELKELLSILKDENQKLILNNSDFEKVETAYKKFQDKKDAIIVIPGTIPDKMITEKNSIEKNSLSEYEKYEKTKNEKRKEYETGKKEVTRCMKQMKEMNEELENGKEILSDDLDKKYLEIREKVKFLCYLPADIEIRNDQEFLNNEFLPEAERLYQKSIKSLRFLEYINIFSSLQVDLEKKKWGLPVKEDQIQVKIQNSRQLIEKLLRDYDWEPQKRKMLEENLNQIQEWTKKDNP